ncbi:group II intron maturase-specific domain-containing protein [Bradyrhizobium sp. ORS 86]|uniref:group II intron maturase-specific domain-containing protein n=1 Tax=Bradyrhizobium sp. ORS 86 TaxID=1685970 RepID=UPI00388FC07C
MRRRQSDRNYYGRYYKSAVYPTLRHLDQCLARWAMSKYKRLRRHRRRGEHRVRDIACLHPHAVGPLADAAQVGGWTVRAGRAETFTSGSVSAWW